MSESPNLSTRTYTFLFTDLEGSTQLWEHYPQAMKPALARHDEILRQAVELSNGQIIKTTGDGLHAYFISVMDGINACLNAQRNLALEPWGETGPLKVRMGLHVGEAQPRGGDFYGSAVNRAARLMSAAHGGQVLISTTAANLVRDLLEGDISLQDLGEHRLKDLDRSEHIFQLIHPDLIADFPPIISLDYRPNNLPAQLTPLIGRASELAEIIAQIKSERTRILTLTGPGGIGKTRLSLQVSAELIDFFENGIYFVDLAPIRDPESVPAAVAQIVGIEESSRRPPLEEIKTQLKSKSMLLLLDNFEQVTTAAPMISELMNACPRLKALVTSREALHIRGEFIYPVPPLDLPEANLGEPGANHFESYEAVQLFAERAKAVKHDFNLDGENARIVAEICMRLDGLPLAIELAAARTRLFPPEALLKRLENRLNILSGGASDLPDRQQTLRNAIDWSYELLDNGEKSLFMLLSVFTGGFSFEAVEEVQDRIDLPDFTRMDILDGLTSLDEKSLISRMNRENGEIRLRMLETIREYAQDKLGEYPEFETAVQIADAEYFAEFTRNKWEYLIGSEREAGLAALSAEIENIRTAWRYWVAKKDLEYLSKFVDSLWLLYDVRGWYHATVNLTNELLEVLSAVPSTPERVQQEIVLQTSLARALLAIKGYTSEVEQAYKRAIELWQNEGEIPEIFPVLRGLTAFYTYLGKFEKSTAIAKKILSLAESRHDEGMLVEG
ncbi:MAG: adenylate/guanylate cyclase domain-containing protein, partial [Anaerolineales bacterium]